LGGPQLNLAAEGYADIALGMQGLVAAPMVLRALPLMIGAFDMVHSLPIWLLAAGFLGAGAFNTMGKAGTRNDFARWGYPPWWNVFTGGLEIVSAVLIAIPAGRIIGLALGTLIIAAAVLTVLRHRDAPHLVPLGVFSALIVLAWISSSGSMPSIE
jgi:hypothetical protein